MATFMERVAFVPKVGAMLLNCCLFTLIVWFDNQETAFDWLGCGHQCPANQASR
jgi:hypothetical protein